MSTEIKARDAYGREYVLATTDPELCGKAQCTSCPTQIQRTADGDLADGVRAHYRTVHPERRVR